MRQHAWPAPLLKRRRHVLNIRRLAALLQPVELHAQGRQAYDPEGHFHTCADGAPGRRDSHVLRLRRKKRYRDQGQEEKRREFAASAAGRGKGRGPAKRRKTSDGQGDGD